jgi:hypothetical protein
MVQRAAVSENGPSWRRFDSELLQSIHPWVEWLLYQDRQLHKLRFYSRPVEDFAVIPGFREGLRTMLDEGDTPNKPLEWTGRHRISAIAPLHFFLPATQGQR